MATQEEISKMLTFFEKHRPQNAFDDVRKQGTGVFAVLKYINDTEEPVKSKDICASLHISSARMAVILSTMEKKGLINKCSDEKDGRTKLLTLSDKGKQTADRIKMQMITATAKLIDEIGIEHLISVFEDIKRIKCIMQDSIENITEEIND